MKVCSSCGTKNRNDANHCSKCGNSSFGTRDNNDNSSGERSMHWIYFFFIGCWAWSIPAMFIIPLFTSGGRRLIASFAGYW